MTPAIEDFDGIRRRLSEIASAAKPLCPQSSDRTLYDCLRSSQKCGEACPHKNDWIGPQA